MKTKSFILIATLCCALLSATAFASKLQEYRSAPKSNLAAVEKHH